ncbi:MAG: hypothetical protein P4M08_04460 [Oligoflexia bacterium]|nr:hypothetical protein [Oligoflexia bacterium]
MENIPEVPPNSFRVVLNLKEPKPRLDSVLMEALRAQKECLTLRNLSRGEFKELFKKKKIRIKGQSATPSSALAKGLTYVDIHGFTKDSTL